MSTTKPLPLCGIEKTPGTLSLQSILVRGRQLWFNVLLEDKGSSLWFTVLSNCLALELTHSGNLQTSDL